MGTLYDYGPDRHIIEKTDSASTMSAALVHEAEIVKQPLRPMGNVSVPAGSCPHCHRACPPDTRCRSCGWFHPASS